MSLHLRYLALDFKGPQSWFLNFNICFKDFISTFFPDPKGDSRSHRLIHSEGHIKHKFISVFSNTKELTLLASCSLLGVNSRALEQKAQLVQTSSNDLWDGYWSNIDSIIYYKTYHYSRKAARGESKGEGSDLHHTWLHRETNEKLSLFIILVVLRNSCVTWWNVQESSMVHMSAWLSSLEIFKRLYLQQQFLITVCFGAQSLVDWVSFFFSILMLEIKAK